MPRISPATVIFDVGNVLMTFDGRRFSRIFTDTEADAQLLYAALFDRPEWSLLDAGAISHDTMRRIAEAALPERLHPNLRACMDHWHEHSEPLGAVSAAWASTCSQMQTIASNGSFIARLPGRSRTVGSLLPSSTS